MHIALPLLLILALVFGPQLWVRYQMRRHSAPLPELPGTGGELARHLLNRFGLNDVRVEATPRGDHYDPEARAVRLLPEHLDGKSLTAVAIAAHEVGHALQHHSGDRMLHLRSRMVQLARPVERLGALAMVAIPVIALATRAPGAGLMLVAAGLLSLAFMALVHLVTLPVEWDASFGKALPILRGGGYIQPEQEAAVQSVLRAAALTYVAVSLASLLNVARWAAILLRR
ncbi:zinc metallopeptidase [Ectothiorhodospiraceae bacterium 2226]|nr:zinc metallopeptidase [Ectothiorhodospiraceae bacterium 2226]